MRIGFHDTEAAPLIVAEIGNNHEGDPGRARELVEAAAAAGAGAVKFQTFVTEHFVRRADEARFAQLKGYELGQDAFAELFDRARSLGLAVLATPLDHDSLAFLAPLVDGLKIASGDITFVPLIEAAAATDRPLVISTGASEIEEVEHAVNVVADTRSGDADLALLHCVSAYPTPPAEANLQAIPVLEEHFELPTGYSDHTLGIDAAIAAVALGAVVVEKHLTLEGIESDFRDHALSATPDELAQLVDGIASPDPDLTVDAALLGRSEKTVQPSEAEAAGAIRRSIVARRKLDAGAVLERDDLDWLRPGGGMDPGSEEQLLGRRLKQALAAGEPFTPDSVE